MTRNARVDYVPCLMADSPIRGSSSPPQSPRSSVNLTRRQLLGAGGYFAWDSYQEKKKPERRLQWGFFMQMDRETKAVAYHMSW